MGGQYNRGITILNCGLNMSFLFQDTPRPSWFKYKVIYKQETLLLIHVPAL